MTKHAQGHCTQRYSPVGEPEKLGPLAQRIATGMCGESEEAGRAHLIKICSERAPTLVKKSFDRGRLHLVSVQYLRWLTALRGFKNWSLVHFIGYSMKSYHSHHLTSLMAERQRLKNLGRDAVSCNTYKLLLNSLYGVMLQEQSRYTKTKLMTDHSLSRPTSANNRKKLLSVTLMGIKFPRETAVSKHREKSKVPRRQSEDPRKRVASRRRTNVPTPQLMLAVTLRNEDAAIKNLLQERWGRETN